MRWRTGSTSASEAAAANAGSGPAAPLGSQEPQTEHHILEEASTSASASTNASSSSSPLVAHPHAHANEQSDTADSSVSASALIYSANEHSHSNSSSSSGQVLDPAADALSSSAMDPDGDPPYKRSHQFHRHAPQSLSQSQSASKDGAQVHVNSGSNDEQDDDMDGLPALEAVNPDDGEDDDTGDDHEVPWKPQATQSTCEFTHTITNYSQKRDSGCKKAEYSATTVDEFGNRWRLIVYVNGNGRASNHHLSLFLQVRTDTAQIFHRLTGCFNGRVVANLVIFNRSRMQMTCRSDGKRLLATYSH